MIAHKLHDGVASFRHLISVRLPRLPQRHADVLVIGGGIAGLTAALAAADSGCQVVLLQKDDPKRSNTAWAQGGISAVLDEDRRAPEDSIDLHTRDTVTAGAGLCDEQVVSDLLAGANDGIDFLLAHGCRFDPDHDAPQRLGLGREGGHSQRRILHANGDATGREISRSLTEAVARHPDIELVSPAFAIDLLTDDDGACCGALLWLEGHLQVVQTGATVLSSGGAGQVFRETSNPAVATGDGLAMAYRAGASLADLEFMQFHPTSLYIAGQPRRLITEAMRGEGAHLINHLGERFMPRYHESAELAPRDIVSRAMIAEIKRTDFPHVWLDATHLGGAFLQRRFPTIHRKCAELGIDISKDWIPVHPSAHYLCGGVLADTHGRTALRGLYAAGEVACTGFHGANRLASNSLLEGLVVGLRCGRLATADQHPRRQVDGETQGPRAEVEDLDVTDLRQSLRATMWRHAGIERHLRGLDLAARSIRFWREHQACARFRDPHAWELQNMLLVGHLMVEAAARRTASVGTHHRLDGSGEVDPTHHALAQPPH